MNYPQTLLGGKAPSNAVSFNLKPKPK
jgi:hypothetical protein